MSLFFMLLDYILGHIAQLLTKCQYVKIIQKCMSLYFLYQNPVMFFVLLKQNMMCAYVGLKPIPTNHTVYNF